MKKKTGVGKGIVGLSVVIALCLISTSGIGYSWEDPDPYPWNMSEFQNSHEESVPIHEVDASLMHFMENGDCVFDDITIDPGQYAGTEEDPVIISDHNGKLLVFHVHCALQIVWDGDPAPPEGMTSMELRSSASLYRDVDNRPDYEDWRNKDYDNHGIILDEEGSKGDEFWLHVVEENYNYQHNDVYRLDIHVSGAWWDGPIPVPVSTLSTSMYFKIF